MSADDLAALAALPGWGFGFALVLARVSAAVMLLPALGEAELPATVRAGMALAITVLLLPGLAPLLPRVPVDPVKTAAMVCAEVVTGLWLGWLARLLAQSLPIGGQIIGYMLGLSNALQPDPALGGQASVVARLFSVAAPVLLLVSGLYTLPLAALAASFSLVAPGTLLPAGDVAETVVSGVAASFGLALRLAAPFVIAATVWQVCVGLVARLIPRLQVYLMAMPGQILGGLLLLAALLTGLAAAWLHAAGDGFAHLPGLT